MGKRTRSEPQAEQYPVVVRRGQPNTRNPPREAPTRADRSQTGKMPVFVLHPRGTQRCPQVRRPPDFGPGMRFFDGQALDM
jgi:hypothetical protein